MWKFVARGIRETIERRACRTNVYSQSSQETNPNGEVKTSLVCRQKILSPNVTLCKDFFGSAKSSGTKGNQDDSKWDTKHTWSEAVGWSSILAVGWVVCQTLCLRKTIFERETREALTSRLPQVSEDHFKYLFGQVLNLERKRVLPITHCAGKSDKSFIEEREESQWTADKPFGPITVEEALKEAADDLANVHNYVIGQYELRYGMKAIEEKRYKDAIRHFKAGAKMSSPASMFNLGVCYELGLGTNADDKKALKYYTDAAEQGHADALYNLGVFHVQGRGGFPIDIDRARSYFVKAAELGQTKAQHALDLERDANIANKSKVLSPPPSIHEKAVNYVNRGSTGLLSKLASYRCTPNSNYDLDSVTEGSSYNCAPSDIKTPTEVFLDLLGLNEPGFILPPTVASGDRMVPC